MPDPQQIAGCTWRGHAIVDTVDGEAAFYAQPACGPWLTGAGEDFAKKVAGKKLQLHLVRDPVVVEVDLAVALPAVEAPAAVQDDQAEDPDEWPPSAEQLAQQIVGRCLGPEELPNLIELKRRILQLADVKFPRQRAAIADATAVKTRTLYGYLGGSRRRRHVLDVAGDGIAADSDQLSGPMEEGRV